MCNRVKMKLPVCDGFCLWMPRLTNCQVFTHSHDIYTRIQNTFCFPLFFVLCRQFIYFKSICQGICILFESVNVWNTWAICFCSNAIENVLAPVIGLVYRCSNSYTISIPLYNSAYWWVLLSTTGLQEPVRCAVSSLYPCMSWKQNLLDIVLQLPMALLPPRRGTMCEDRVKQWVFHDDFKSWGGE